eukprot:CAMPEP_0202474262 /NCGR_PEP_ID=MMETSP1360-20130828/92287_1 /ASSEMBLY_ACC=CAM_ASM_000848 /TAXON_ID=515479 /ORGANISM="Licmophora paradoxa, Strain CCMP2313" /LENGTH=70 /DNA_ID=CAMNT_0049101371 /DNA_START=437 /DNA_END=649 /DNA_ORIENTATION=-
MPWQTVPSLAIIFGMFNVTAGAIWGIDKIAYGGRPILRDDWEYNLDGRDQRVLQYRKELAKQAAASSHKM